MSTSQAQAVTSELLADNSLGGTWKLDQSRSSVRLQSKSMWGAMRVNGVFRDVTGSGEISEAGKVSGEISVTTASIDTRNSTRDGHLRSAHFFDSDNYPAITFSLTEASASGTELTMSGTLTVRDQSRLVTFPATATLQGDSQVTVDATVNVDRSAYAMTYSPLPKMVSLTSVITVQAVFTRD